MGFPFLVQYVIKGLIIMVVIFFLGDTEARDRIIGSIPESFLLWADPRSQTFNDFKKVYFLYHPF